MQNAKCVEELSNSPSSWKEGSIYYGKLLVLPRNRNEDFQGLKNLYAYSVCSIARLARHRRLLTMLLRSARRCAAGAMVVIWWNCIICTAPGLVRPRPILKHSLGTRLPVFSRFEPRRSVEGADGRSDATSLIQAVNPGSSSALEGMEVDGAPERTSVEQPGLELSFDRDAAAPEAISSYLPRSPSRQPHSSPKPLYGLPYSAIKSEQDPDVNEVLTWSPESKRSRRTTYCGLRRRTVVVIAIISTVIAVVGIVVGLVLGKRVTGSKHKHGTRRITWHSHRSVVVNVIGTSYILVCCTNNDGEIMMTNRISSASNPWSQSIRVLSNDATQLGTSALQVNLCPIRLYYGKATHPLRFRDGRSTNSRIGMGSDVAYAVSSWNGIAKPTFLEKSDPNSGVGATSLKYLARLYVRNITTGYLARWTLRWGTVIETWSPIACGISSDTFTILQAEAKFKFHQRFLTPINTSWLFNLERASRREHFLHHRLQRPSNDQASTRTDYIFYQSMTGSLVCGISASNSGFTTFHVLSAATPADGTKLHAWYDDGSHEGSGEGGATLFYQGSGAQAELKYLKVRRTGEVLATGSVRSSQG
ncbi:hypothetical protein CERZMDRAFT_88334 [Cercospora zeae-maydis SCOH1-5]|uniref:Uncharacterized protein n=1 Tax=Cercospora zeae-maydis SCOH1-5 TaxID=717836 RepID=A0A6A6F3D8_9PEZI|nr:hypothetical protein CERZMDRAFT_88334 [Cercospora zeae-maydis SCOH1-5]